MAASDLFWKPLLYITVQMQSCVNNLTVYRIGEMYYNQFR